MNMFDYKKFYKSHHRMIKIVGVWILDNPHTEKIPSWYNFYTFFVQYILMGPFTALLLMELILHGDSLKNIATLGYVIMTCLMGNIKRYFLLYKKDYFISMLKQYDQEMFQPKNDDEMGIVKICLKEFIQVKNCLTYFSYYSVSISIITPFFHEKPNGLPYDAWYPTDVTVMWVYVFAYIHQSISILLIAISFIYGEVLVIQSLTFMGLQCDLLCYRLKNIKADFSKDYQNKRLLSQYVRNHLLILKFLDVSENIYGMMYFFQLISCTTTFCMALFLLTVTEMSLEFVDLSVYAMAQAILLLTPCLFSTKLTKKSENISTAAYTSDWLNGSTSFKKMLVLIILRSQKSLRFYAANFFELSLTTFVAILKASYSYFALMNKMSNKNQA